MNAASCSSSSSSALSLTPANSACTICQNTTNTGFNYGVLSCGACKMFFRRVIFERSLETCRRPGNCYRKCRFCRFQKCIQAGMVYTPTESILDPKNSELLSVLIFNLIHMDSHRNYQLQNCFFDGNPSVAEIAKTPGPLKFQQRPQAKPRSLGEWVFITGITSIDYLKKFTYCNQLNEADRSVLLKLTFLDFSILTDAMRASESRQGSISFPDGSDVIRTGLPGVSRNLENDIKCRLAARVNELRVTKEEFLLLAAIFFCNPSLPKLTQSGRGILNSFQKVYSSALLQYCLNTYQRTGPSRFTDLLSIFQIIGKTRQNIGHLFIIGQMHRPCPVPKIYIYDH